MGAVLALVARLTGRDEAAVAAEGAGGVFLDAPSAVAAGYADALVTGTGWPQ